MQLILSQHISRLLFEHECVIVPDFGAFLTRYHHAEVNPATHMMRPPSRRIYFNPGLKENDGLLAKSLNLTENISYKEALAVIRSEVSAWNDFLHEGEKVQLKGIGRLFIDEQSKMQFSPTLENNYQRDSYGLSIFRSPAVEREVKIRTAISRSIEKHTPVPVASVSSAPVANEPSKKPSVRIPWAAVLGPVIFAGIVGAGYVGLKSDPLQNISGLNWLEWSHSHSIYDLSGEVINADKSPSPEADANAPAGDKEAAAIIDRSEAEKAIYDEIPTVQLYPYHIVVGSFKEMANAETYVTELKARGYDAYTARGDNRYMRVAVGNFATRDQADKALLGIRQSLNSQAWVYTN